MMNAPDLNQFLSRNQESFVNASVSELLNQLFERKNISKAALAKQAGMNYMNGANTVTYFGGVAFHPEALAVFED